MKVLMLFHSALYPPVSGVIKRNLHMFQEAASRHEVSIIVQGEQDEQAFREHFGHLFREMVCIPVKRSVLRARLQTIFYLLTGRSEARRLYLRKTQHVLDDMLARDHYDLVHLSTPFMFYYRFPEGTTIVCDTHNVEYDNIQRMYREAHSLFRRFFFLLIYRAIRRDEIRNLRKSNVIMATSERDASMFRKDLPEKSFVVVPNGVDDKNFSPWCQSTIPDSMVFTGLMEYYPNEQGVLYFMEKVFPLILLQVPSATISIVGAQPSIRVTRWASSKVEVTGYVEDVRPYLARAQVVIIPLWIGGGTRLKALEAVAMKKSIVSTSIGCEGISFTHGKDILIADTPETFAAAVVRLFRDPRLRESLAESAFANLLPSYRWEAIGEKLDEAYQLAAKGSCDEAIAQLTEH